MVIRADAVTGFTEIPLVDGVQVRQPAAGGDPQLPAAPEHAGRGPDQVKLPSWAIGLTAGNTSLRPLSNTHLGGRARDDTRLVSHNHNTPDNRNMRLWRPLLFPSHEDKTKQNKQDNSTA